ncbi:MAG TPA: DUF6328 family protein [Pseudonocardiaceae bacterium]|jgi:hypothetical protein|nr:DUF6328 family protein [Pseudonocardiaceae bacterium]
MTAGPGEPAADDTETPQAKLTRNMAELLQELRVAQAGVQILFAFLLSVAFTARFAQATRLERTTELVTVLLTTGSTALLMAPAAWHRIYFRQGRRPDIIYWANRFAIAGLALLAAALTGAVLLLVEVVVGGWTAIVLAAASGVLFTLIWFVLPLARRGQPPLTERELEQRHPRRHQS